MTLAVFSDGNATMAPKNGAYGVVVVDVTDPLAPRVLAEHAGLIPNATSYEAEFRAFREATQFARSLVEGGRLAEAILFFLDSQDVEGWLSRKRETQSVYAAEQVRVAKENIQALRERGCDVKVQCISRRLNRLADRLATNELKDKCAGNPQVVYPFLQILSPPEQPLPEL